ncbi:DUF4177 domain-containing protein [Roseovarius sp. SCSIO 43702]|uniref:DUF4177 domain-containing protein n=1 Tax=Roseovarius sp. SCSIO 43702 TaxID=2823043 RepID=UPI001C73232A|nr:DUF4177 domain-containing protein [Roseovarius sp. SCSIO 43702]QYX58165.1 DUF4177 domain-containing protein [Roseovarius sp. SCSIO 43702]
MQRVEYKVIPAPNKGLKDKGVKGPEARFAHAVETLMNEMGAKGWSYLRADILPSEERQGLTSTTTVYRTLLVFQRPVPEAHTGPAPTPPESAESEPDAAPEPATEDETPRDTSPEPDTATPANSNRPKG